MFSRACFASWLLVTAAAAAPPLTTIQDVIYKADGSSFNGILTISWKSFEAADTSAIATQLLTVRVVDGVLRVKLVPNIATTPPMYYAVVYNSEGRVQFTETWAVPVSPQPLRIRDVRVATPGPPGEGTTPVLESNVVGLIADLGARPVKGAGFAAGRVAFVNAQNQLDSVNGPPGDCVRVDGSSGPCGSAPSYIDADAPAGIVDGSNTWFSLTGTPEPAASVSVYRNGLLQQPGADYSLTGRTIQFNAASAPQPGDTLLASYRLGGGATGSPLLFANPQVLCSGTGAVVNSASFSSLGTCAVPAGLLANGDRVEIRFDIGHQGATAGYSFEIRWGNTTVLSRDAAVADIFVTGRVDANLAAGNTRFGTLSWGSMLPLSAGVGSASDPYNSGLTIDFRGKVGQAGETLALQNYTVVRVP
ncbi:MAG TPA: hypothetical protein VKT49_10300 [Bryobacteraceae bacterium]|nr:hypothetical protein [Bryobacteraceae bacterium]